jgi:hypothetical protein
MALTNGIYKGKGLSLTINSIEYNLDAKSVALSSEDKDVITFADIASGAKQWFFTVTALFDAGTGSLWRYVWDNAGTEDVAFTFKPYGNATASATQPHFTGTLTVGTKPDISGDANSTFEFEVRFDVDGEPTMDTGV